MDGSTFFILFIIYLVLCVLVGLEGDKRQIGYWGATVASLFLTPVIGFIITSLSPPVKVSNKITNPDSNISTTNEDNKINKTFNPDSSIADELTKLKKLFDEGTLTKDEFDNLKNKLLN